ncbi:bifunctional nicotinamide-nucleotide adenylyltransferase/Nudix hydroxylase [Methylocystis parvus]|uniref:Bifunctional nicotinamide-nucleotide adenylyltransferase/Nudix hydroxylase n=1 Tax=Methylocystis parvus TaxID=134 RepID=A0A6B8MBJ4_9HYPH|nr:bifunctional nicotinamide-nucleotide adenylyltransferase/Nudix hydroxylase [Methylocystis parvus]QGM98989.1 bifunctional nicotinamide-nucleotide adenylyltransferase/Nudix hydroxylase [Methylocystis parvus]WBK00651.1 bifunctional nicotinamide-nucleotide adenylyltransferase/Nudix hydroxylase [Methylocystis parvus OBBP]
MTRYDLAVFIGRFEPFHLGHLAILRRALALSQRVVVLVGSAEAPRTAKNPWTYAERVVMIEAALGADAKRVATLPLRDHLYNDNAWLAEAQSLVASVAGDANTIALFGFSKDASSYYLKAFPQWELVDAASVPLLSATELRRHLYSEEAGALRLIEANVPRPVFEIIDAFRKTEAYRQTLEEFRHVESYRAAWADAPYAPIFVTVDAVVAHSGHVLLVKRKAQPGKGLWALPGGFVAQDETLRDAALRELREETRLKIPIPVLRGNLRGEAVFDHPGRSLRGRTVTHAFYFEFPSGELPPVRGADDAARARWIPISEVQNMRASLFEDHFFILEHFLGAGW